MLMPTQQAVRRDGDWDAWLRAWMALWGQVYHSAFWNTLWLHLVTRLAKHDTAGAPLPLSPTPTPMLEHAVAATWSRAWPSTTPQARARCGTPNYQALNQVLAGTRSDWAPGRVPREV